MKYLVGLLLSAMLAGPVLAAMPPSRQALPVKGVEQRVDLLERKVRALSDLVLRLNTLQREVQLLRGEVEVQNHALDALKKRQRNLYLDVDRRLSSISTGVVPAAHGTAMPAPAAIPSAPSASTPPREQLMQTPAVVQQPTGGAADPVVEEAEYRAAFEILMQHRYGDASKAFRGFLGKYQGSAFSDNAQYWLAEASYVTRDFDAALVEFRKVIQDYPESSKVPDALLKTSLIQYEKQQWSEARETLETLINNYPSSTAGRLAGKRLERMRTEGR
ncbi:tol-pal system protein YbgF [Candidatus Vondammii sp. HM_W22]|uniref:tol-pal system protein YbgF n=1 Tax=Candidatus Vondammii sp. HM_W22 TaxID=2687299 RepID=UPI002E7C3A61|nr:tol-pal system protein YbgF [Candidatus Vondammii sp. HM_W22]